LPRNHITKRIFVSQREGLSSTFLTELQQSDERQLPCITAEASGTAPPPEVRAEGTLDTSRPRRQMAQTWDSEISQGPPFWTVTWHTKSKHYKVLKSHSNSKV
jgi:hypothetical protein